MKKLIPSLTISGVFMLSLASGQAMAFVDKDHSAEGVKNSATMYTGSAKKGRFLSYGHNPEDSINKTVPNQNWKSAGNCGFLDCDHIYKGNNSL